MAGNRCSSCSKWVSLENDEPQEDSIEIVSDSEVQIDVTISRNCADCGQEMKNHEFSGVSTDIDVEWTATHAPHEDGSDDGEHGEWEVETSAMELTESGGGRYAKNMIGFECTATVTCKCGETTTVQLSDQAAASEFDEV